MSTRQLRSPAVPPLRTARSASWRLLAVGALLLTGLQGCQDEASGGSRRVEAGRWTVLDTRTDLADPARAKQNAEDALIRHPGIDAMVGLWAYNGPAILSALRDAGRLGDVAVISFDEEQEVLQGIEDGWVEGTVVQQPFEFGFQSMRILAALARGEDAGIPETGIVDVPVQVVRADNAAAFRQGLAAQLASADVALGRPENEDTVRLAFLTNNTGSFWNIARAGVRKAEADLNVSCEFLMPPNGTADDQLRMVESVIAKGLSGLAISPNDAEHQVEMINQACAAMNVLCHDSDAPGSQRICFVGTNNYRAGRAAGRLVKEALPDGGEIMLFVGRMDASNAIERRRGILDELLGAP